MAAGTVILLPPSEGKTPGGRGRWSPASGRFKGLGEARERVAAALAHAMEGEAEAARLLGVKGVALAAARVVNLRTVGARSLPAHQRYSGVVWSHLGSESLTDEAMVRARRSVITVSGLLGLASFNDPVPDYKLKVGVALPGLGSVAGFWKSMVTEELAVVARRKVVIDLLTGEHRRPIAFDRLGARRIVRVEFIDGERRAIGHFAKAAKGMLARHLLLADDPVAALPTFVWEGWKTEPDTGDGAGLVEVRFTG